MSARSTLSALLSLIALATGPVFAGTCVLNPLPTWRTSDTCKCSDLETIDKQLRGKGLIPPGFKLAAACGVRPVPEDPRAIMGTFHLRGEAALSGQVRHEYTPAGNLFFLYPAPADAKTGLTKIRELRFSDEQAAGRSLKIPPLGSGSTCWEAQGTLTLTQLLVIEDMGTDYTGTYVSGFRPQELSPYNPCKN